MEQAGDKGITIDELARKLTPKKRRFAEGYLKNGWNGTAAAIEAGCGTTRDSAAVLASRMLKDDRVRAYISARSREIYEQLGLSPERVTAEYVRLYRRAVKAEPVVAWDGEKKEYVETGEWHYDAKTALNCLEALGKHAGMFVQKVEVTPTVKGPLEGLSTEELRALIRALGENGEGGERP